MKKFFKKTLACCLSVLLILGASVSFGCQPKSDIWIDPNRTQLYIGIKENGIGREWIDAIVTEYEKVYTDIQVIVESKNTEFDTDQLKATINYNRQDMYFVSMLDYYGFVNLDGSSDLLLDMTDVVTEAYEDEPSIWDKMDESNQNYYNVGKGVDKKIYAIPYCSSYWGLIYDKDFFRGMNLYNVDGYVGIDGVIDTDDDFYGPDGLEDTFDDGLPGTWEDMKLLIDLMVEKGITPFTWTGQYYTYRTQWLNSIIASYEGIDDFNLRLSFNGTDSQFGEITDANAYQLVDQEGVKAALTVAKHIASSSNFYSSKVTNLSQSHKQAQLEFVKSVKTKYPIGFLIESGWWENEAKNYFAEMENSYGEDYAYGKRNFGWLPFPRFVGTDGIADQTNENIIMYGGGGDATVGACIISKATEKAEIAKSFVKFAHTYDMLELFTVKTGMKRTFNYDMSEENEAKLSPYAREIIELTNNPNVKIAGGKIINQMRSDNRTYFNNWGFGAKIGGTTVSDPLLTFINKANVSVSDYIDGIKAIYNETSWKQKLGF